MSMVLSPTLPAPAIDEQRDRRDARLAFLVLCVVHVVLWTLVPSLTYSSVPQDTVEGIAWGNLWQLGYDKHPFLAPWLSAFVTDLFGSVGWPVYLAAQLCIALAFWAVWSLAQDILKSPLRALAAVLLLEGVAFFNSPPEPSASSFILNPNLMMVPTWAMLSLTAYRAMRTPTAMRWAHAGLWAGLAVLAKYESGIIFVALTIVLLATREGRRCLATPGFYVGILVATLAVSPHLVWLAQHDFLPITYAFGKLDTTALPGVPHHGGKHPFYQPLLFLRGQIGYTLMAFALFLILKRRRQGFDRHNFDHVFAATLSVGIVLIALLFGFATGGYLITAWGFPFYSLIGIALVLFFVPDVDRRQLTRLGAAVAALMVALVARHAWTFHREPWDQAVFPYKPLIDHVTQEWDKHQHAPLHVVAGDRWTVAGMAAYSMRAVVPFFGWDQARNPWLREGEVQARGAVFVHELKDPAADVALIQGLKARYPALTHEETMDFPPLSAASLAPIRFWIAYLPPRG